MRDPALGSEMCRLGIAQQVSQVSEGPCADLGTRRYRTSERKLEQGYRIGWAEEEKKGRCPCGGKERSYLTGQNLCDLHDEGIFVAQCGPWLKKEKKLADIHNGDMRIFASREREFGGHGRVRHKIRIFGGDHRGGSKVQVDVGVKADERSEKLVRNTDVVHEDVQRVLLKKEVIWQVEKGTPVSGPTGCELLTINSWSKKFFKKNKQCGAKETAWERR